VARCRSAFGTKSYIYVGRGPAAAEGRGASGQGNMSGLVRRYWLGKFVVGGVPLCYGINSAIERISDAPFEVPEVRCVPYTSPRERP
jgi:hypothetical protein